MQSSIFDLGLYFTDCWLCQVFLILVSFSVIWSYTSDTEADAYILAWLLECSHPYWPWPIILYSPFSMLFCLKNLYNHHESWSECLLISRSGSVSAMLLRWAILGIVALLFPENSLLHFMQIVFIRCLSLFYGKNKKNMISLPSSELAQRVVKVNSLHAG